MSVAEWDNEYARFARAASQLRTVGRSHNNNAGELSALQQGLVRLDATLDHLPLPAPEVQRRRRLIHHLQQTTTTTTTPLSNAPSAGGLSSSPAPPQQSLMTAAIQQQDALIDELAVGVGRLKHQSQGIQDEAKMHVRLLNDMEANLDTAYAGLEDETRRAARLKEDQSVWRLQLIVAGLSIVLVLLVLVGLTP
jgi:hypothetical protein